MTLVQSYDSHIVESLPKFYVSKQALTANRAHLHELGTVICQHGLQEAVGVSLLHKHFDIAPDEQLVKEFAGNKATIRPQPTDTGSKVIPYLWKLETDQETGQGVYYPLEFVVMHEKTAGTDELVTMVHGKEDFLSALAAKLFELGLEDIFGISALYSNNFIHLHTDEMLVETTDHETRTLTLSPFAKTQLEHEEMTETNWQFTAHIEGDATTDCRSHCISHCVGH